VDLANRAGRLIGDDGSYAGYEAVGAKLRSVVDQALLDDWDWTAKRVLDFGAGSGRVLRHFLAEAERAHFEACDIDAAAIRWLNANLNPPVSGLVNVPSPPLPRDDDSYDLVYAFSVFTHITDAWAAWLIELHRVLSPGGWLIASFLGEGMSQAIADEPWDPDRIGMNASRPTRTGTPAGQASSFRRGGSASTGGGHSRLPPFTTAPSTAYTV
jgi:SAM-dependent methyltransferase